MREAISLCLPVKYEITSRDVAARYPVHFQFTVGQDRGDRNTTLFPTSHDISRGAARTAKLDALTKAKKKIHMWWAYRQASGQASRQAGRQTGEAGGSGKKWNGKRCAIISCYTSERILFAAWKVVSLHGRGKTASGHSDVRRYNFESRNENYFDTSLSIRTIARSSSRSLSAFATNLEKYTFYRRKSACSRTSFPS